MRGLLPRVVPTVGREGKGEEMRGEGREVGEGRGEEAFLVMCPRRLSALNPPPGKLTPDSGNKINYVEPDDDDLSRMDSDRYKSVSYYGEEKEYGEHHYGYKPEKKKVYVPVFVPEKEKKKSKIFRCHFLSFLLMLSNLSVEIITKH